MMIMNLRKSSLRQMMRTGLVNDRIKRKVLEGLKPIVVGGTNDAHGDLKEPCHHFNFV